MEGSFLAVKSQSGWIQQARTALATATEKQGQMTLDEMAEKDHPNFCLLIEALYALGQPVSPELLLKANMGPIE